MTGNHRIVSILGGLVAFVVGGELIALAACLHLALRAKSENILYSHTLLPFIVVIYCVLSTAWYACSAIGPCILWRRFAGRSLVLATVVGLLVGFLLVFKDGPKFRVPTWFVGLPLWSMFIPAPFVGILLFRPLKRSEMARPRAGSSQPPRGIVSANQ